MLDTSSRRATKRLAQLRRERRRRANAEAATDEREAERFSILFGDAHAPTALDALARLKHDVRMGGVALEGPARTMVPRRRRTVPSGQLTQRTRIAFAAVAIEAASGLSTDLCVAGRRGGRWIAGIGHAPGTRVGMGTQHRYLVAAEIAHEHVDMRGVSDNVRASEKLVHGNGGAAAARHGVNAVIRAGHHIPGGKDTGAARSQRRTVRLHTSA